ncbi:hypothetical protein [Geodermatophilus sp. URMC 63]
MASTAVILPVSVILLMVLPNPGARAAAIVGGTVSGIVGLPTALAAIDPPRKTLPTALALASIICALTLLLILLSSSIKGHRWRLSLLAPLSLLPVIQFWQATSYTSSQLITSVTPEVRVVVQTVNAEERKGIVEITLANPGDVRASLFTSQLIYCFTTEDDWLEVGNLSDDALLTNEYCSYLQVLPRNSHVDANTTQTYSVPWRASTDRSFSLVVMRSYYAREDRIRLTGTPNERSGAAGCHGHVTTYRLETDTRFKGLVQPARLLTFDERNFFLSYEGAPLCEAESDDELKAELGLRTIIINRGDWLTDDSQQD